MGRDTFLSYGSYDLDHNSISALLIDINPTVNPEQIPAKQDKANEMNA